MNTLPMSSAVGFGFQYLEPTPCRSASSTLRE
jgi:hypothetical protein